MKMNDKVISSRAEELLRFRIFIPAVFSFVCLLILILVLFLNRCVQGNITDSRFRARASDRYAYLPNGV